VDDGIVGTSVLRLGAGAWKRVGDFGLITSGSHLRADQITVTDIEAGARYSGGMLSLAASAGARLAGHDVQGARQWGEMSVVWWVARHIAVVGAHGRYPSEPGRGAPGGRYSAISLRLATRPPVLDVAIPRRDRGASPEFGRPVVASFQARRENDSTYVLSVRAPGARSVEIAGDFNDWQPTALQSSARRDNFTLKLKLSPGAYKYSVRVDGGEWGLPPGVPALRDDLAGTVALLIIPRR
jgi:hypothetical protein